MGTKQAVCVCCKEVIGCIIIGAKSSCITCPFDGCIFELITADKVFSVVCNSCLDFNSQAYAMMMERS